jgi:hypothetical protein
VRARRVAEPAVGGIGLDRADLVVAARPHDAGAVEAKGRDVGGRHRNFFVGNAVIEDRGVVGSEHRETLGGVGDGRDAAESVVILRGEVTLEGQAELGGERRRAVLRGRGGGRIGGGCRCSRKDREADGDEDWGAGEHDPTIKAARCFPGQSADASVPRPERAE